MGDNAPILLVFPLMAVTAYLWWQQDQLSQPLDINWSSSHELTNASFNASTIQQWFWDALARSGEPFIQQWLWDAVPTSHPSPPINHSPASASSTNQTEADLSAPEAEAVATLDDMLVDLRASSSTATINSTAGSIGKGISCSSGSNASIGDSSVTINPWPTDNESSDGTGSFRAGALKGDTQAPNDNLTVEAPGPGAFQTWSNQLFGSLDSVRQSLIGSTNEVNVTLYDSTGKPVPLSEQKGNAIKSYYIYENGILVPLKDAPVSWPERMRKWWNSGQPQDSSDINVSLTNTDAHSSPSSPVPPSPPPPLPPISSSPPPLPTPSPPPLPPTPPAPPPPPSSATPASISPPVPTPAPTPPPTSLSSPSPPFYCAWTPPQANPQDKAMVDDYAALIKEVYSTVNPSKVPEIPSMLDCWKGSEKELYHTISKQYKVEQTCKYMESRDIGSSGIHKHASKSILDHKQLTDTNIQGQSDTNVEKHGQQDGWFARLLSFMSSSLLPTVSTVFSVSAALVFFLHRCESKDTHPVISVSLSLCGGVCSVSLALLLGALLMTPVLGFTAVVETILPKVITALAIKVR